MFGRNEGTSNKLIFSYCTLTLSILIFELFAHCVYLSYDFHANVVTRWERERELAGMETRRADRFKDSFIFNRYKESHQMTSASLKSVLNINYIMFWTWVHHPSWSTSSSDCPGSLMWTLSTSLAPISPICVRTVALRVFLPDPDPLTAIRTTIEPNSVDLTTDLSCCWNGRRRRWWRQEWCQWWTDRLWPPNGESSA